MQYPQVDQQPDPCADDGRADNRAESAEAAFGRDQEDGPAGNQYDADEIVRRPQSVALEMAEYGVRVNSVCPGNMLDSPLWVNSLFKQYARNQGITEEEVRQKYVNQVPMRRGCSYDDVCNLVVFLASDQSSYMTGQAINVTGGQEMR